MGQRTSEFSAHLIFTTTLQNGLTPFSKLKPSKYWKLMQDSKASKWQSYDVNSSLPTLIAMCFCFVWFDFSSSQTESNEIEKKYAKNSHVWQFHVVQCIFRNILWKNRHNSSLTLFFLYLFLYFFFFSKLTTQHPTDINTDLNRRPLEKILKEYEISFLLLHDYYLVGQI